MFSFSPVLLQITGLPFIRLDNMPLSSYTTFPLSSHHWKTLGCFHILALRTPMKWTFPFQISLSIFWGKTPCSRITWSCASSIFSFFVLCCFWAMWYNEGGLEFTVSPETFLVSLRYLTFMPASWGLESHGNRYQAREFLGWVNWGGKTNHVWYHPLGESPWLKIFKKRAAHQVLSLCFQLWMK